MYLQVILDLNLSSNLRRNQYQGTSPQPASTTLAQRILAMKADHGDYLTCLITHHQKEKEKKEKELSKVLFPYPCKAQKQKKPEHLMLPPFGGIFETGAQEK